MGKVRVKFCGITSAGDAEKAISTSPDALGFVFFKGSPRYVKPETAERIIKKMPPFISAVGVFVNEDIGVIEECVERCGLDVVQLHGDEDITYSLDLKRSRGNGVKLIKAFRVKDKKGLSSIEGYPADAFLLDTYRSYVYGGTGKGFDRALAILAKEYGRPIIVSGGLNTANVYDVIKEVRPYGVDVSSGIESGPGRKDIDLMERFIGEVRRAEQG